MLKNVRFKQILYSLVTYNYIKQQELMVHFIKFIMINLINIINILEI